LRKSAAVDELLRAPELSIAMLGTIDCLVELIFEIFTRHFREKSSARIKVQE